MELKTLTPTLENQSLNIILSGSTDWSPKENGWGTVLLNTSICLHSISLCLSAGCICLQCFDAVGWVAGRASGL